MRFHPSEESRTEVEAYFGIIIDDGQYPAFTIDEAGSTIRSITLCCDPLIPVVIRIG
jgi:hypothetical protein